VVKICKAAVAARAAKIAARNKKLPFKQVLARVRKLTGKRTGYSQHSAAFNLLCRQRIGRAKKQRRVIQRTLRRLSLRKLISAQDLASCAARNWVIRELKKAAQGKPRKLLLKVRDTWGWG